jgi:hypothetical protein
VREKKNGEINCRQLIPKAYFEGEEKNRATAAQQDMRHCFLLRKQK